MEANALRRILVVGAGITGAVTASLLRTALSQKWQIFVWEAAAHPGEHAVVR